MEYFSVVLSGEVRDTSIDNQNILYETDQILDMTHSNAELESFLKLTFFKYVFFIDNLKYVSPKNCSEQYQFMLTVHCHFTAAFERRMTIIISLILKDGAVASSKFYFLAFVPSDYHCSQDSQRACKNTVLILASLVKIHLFVVEIGSIWFCCHGQLSVELKLLEDCQGFKCQHFIHGRH